MSEEAVSLATLKQTIQKLKIEAEEQSKKSKIVETDSFLWAVWEGKVLAFKKIEEIVEKLQKQQEEKITEIRDIIKSLLIERLDDNLEYQQLATDIYRWKHRLLKKVEEKTN